MVPGLGLPALRPPVGSSERREERLPRLPVKALLRPSGKMQASTPSCVLEWIQEGLVPAPSSRRPLGLEWKAKKVLQEPDEARLHHMVVEEESKPALFIFLLSPGFQAVQWGE